MTYKEALNNYVSKLSWLEVSCEELMDTVLDCCVAVAEEVVHGKRAVIALDHYICEMARRKLATRGRNAPIESACFTTLEEQEY